MQRDGARNGHGSEGGGIALPSDNQFAVGDVLFAGRDCDGFRRRVVRKIAVYNIMIKISVVLIFAFRISRFHIHIFHAEGAVRQDKAFCLLGHESGWRFAGSILKVKDVLLRPEG